MYLFVDNNDVYALIKLVEVLSISFETLTAQGEADTQKSDNIYCLYADVRHREPVEIYSSVDFDETEAVLKNICTQIDAGKKIITVA